MRNNLKGTYLGCKIITKVEENTAPTPILHILTESPNRTLGFSQSQFCRFVSSDRDSLETPGSNIPAKVADSSNSHRVNPVKGGWVCGAHVARARRSAAIDPNQIYAGGCGGIVPSTAVHQPDLICVIGNDEE